MQVEALHPVTAEDLLPFSHTIGSHNLLFDAVPDKELVVVEVVFIQIHAVVGPLPHIAKGNLPESPQFQHDLWNLYTGGAEYIELIAGKEAVFLADVLNLIHDQSGCHRIGNGFGFLVPVDAGPEKLLHFQDRAEGIGLGTQVAPIGGDI